MTRLIYYAIAPDTEGRMLRQLAQSLRSLRQHDGEIPVHILCCGPPPSDLMDEANRAHAVVHERPSYMDLLRGYTRHFVEFADYPMLHKTMGYSRLPAAAQVMFCDCDTYWFASPTVLFDSYAEADIYASAEVGSHAYPHYPYVHHYEENLHLLAASEDVSFVPPLNTGVMVMNNGIGQKLEARTALFVDYAVRLRGYERPLSMPVNNPRILDEVATWLTLGGIPSISYGHLAVDDVLLGIEYRPPVNPVVAHYCSGYEEDFFSRNPRLP